MPAAASRSDEDIRLGRILDSTKAALASAQPCPLPVEADMRAFGRYSAFDPSRKQGVHRNNRRTCRVFRGIQWRRSCRKICRHKATYLLGHSLSVDARQETDMPLVAFPA